MMKKTIPWLLIVFGLLTLDMFQGFISIACLVIGITILLDRIWPEKWGDEAI